MTRTLGLIYLGLSAVGFAWIGCLWALWGYRSLRLAVRRWRIARMCR